MGKRQIIEKPMFSVRVLLFFKVWMVQISSNFDEKMMLERGMVFVFNFVRFLVDFGFILESKIDAKSM